ncbi:MAG: DNA-3-methyladenine glycosylase [Candidatus Saccharibacteria bacterium]|nr:DNA-3-methyladenine glycosylase [Candidatus Saccharibacteria bacterium]
MLPRLDDLAEVVAPQLLGSLLIREVDGQRLVGRIVETEAYGEGDAASHSYKGETPRTKVMFGPSGHLYVYFTYGMHYCCNVVCGPSGVGSAVLIRAIEPVEGEAVMAERRKQSGVLVTNGPAKLCQALAIDQKLNGHDLKEEPLKLELRPALPKKQIGVSPRIGITKAVDVPWRFYIKDNPYLSVRNVTNST